MGLFLCLRDGRDQQAQSQAGDDEQQGEPDKEPEAPAKGHAEPEDAQQRDHDLIHDHQKDVGDQLANHQLDRAHWGDQYLLNGAQLVLAHDRLCGGVDGKYLEQHRDQSGHDKDQVIQVGVVEHASRRSDGRCLQITAQAADLGSEKVQCPRLGDGRCRAVAGLDGKGI